LRAPHPVGCTIEFARELASNPRRTCQPTRHVLRAAESARPLNRGEEFSLRKLTSPWLRPGLGLRLGSDSIFSYSSPQSPPGPRCASRSGPSKSQSSASFCVHTGGDHSWASVCAPAPDWQGAEFPLRELTRPAPLRACHAPRVVFAAGAGARRARDGKDGASPDVGPRPKAHASVAAPLT